MMAFLHETLKVSRSVTGRAGAAWAELKRAGFEEGRQFRTFKEVNLAASAVEVIKVVVPVNTILFGLELAVDAGWLKVETLVGGTEGGTFGVTLPVRAQNNQTNRPTPFYVAQTVFTTGGTLADGTLIDITTAKTDSNTNRAFSVGNVGGDERGVSPGTYYFRLTNLDGAAATTGIIKARWEERP